MAIRNTADVTGGKAIAVLSQFISGVNAINPLIPLNKLIIPSIQKNIVIFYQ
jgi:hypothetical protein